MLFYVFFGYCRLFQFKLLAVIINYLDFLGLADSQTSHTKTCIPTLIDIKSCVENNLWGIQIPTYLNLVFQEDTLNDHLQNALKELKMGVNNEKGSKKWCYKMTKSWPN